MALERVDINQCEDRLQIVMHRARYDFVLALPIWVLVPKSGLNLVPFNLLITNIVHR